MKSRRALLVLIWLLAAAAPIRAGEPPPDAKAAQKLFRDAQALFDAGQHAEALEQFRAVLAATGSPNARLYVARCLHALGRLPEAYDEMKATLDEAARRAEAEPRYAPTRDAAAAELAALERKVARVVVALVDPPEGAAVTVAGAPVAGEKLGAPVAVPPGRIAIVASAPDGARAEREVTVAAGEIKSVALMLRAETQPDAATPPRTPAAERPAPAAAAPASGSGLRTLGWVGLGVGAAGLAVFGVAGAMANGEYATLEEGCGGARCSDAKYADVVDRGRTLDGVANVGLVVGALGVAAGAGILLFGSGEPEGPKGAALVGVTGDGVGVRFRQRF